MSIPPAQTSCSATSPYALTPGPGQCYIYLAQNAYSDCYATSGLSCDSSIDYSFPTNPLTGQVVPMSCVGLISCPCPSGAYGARCANHIEGQLPAGVSVDQGHCCSKNNEYRQICASIISDLTPAQQQQIQTAFAGSTDYGVACTPPTPAPAPGPTPAPSPAQQCPAGQYWIDNQCQRCPNNFSWNGQACVFVPP